MAHPAGHARPAGFSLGKPSFLDTLFRILYISARNIVLLVDLVIPFRPPRRLRPFLSMAHKKAAGSTQLGRDSHGQRLGVKISDGDRCLAGQIIVRQRGTSIHPGVGVKKGKDDTLYAGIDGLVKFTNKMVKNFTGALKRRTFANVEEVK